jgi:prolyl-tRNA synthetase
LKTPPALAPIHVAVVPIYKNEEQLALIKAKVEVFSNELRQAGYTVKFDDDDNKRPGWKFAEYEAKGVPVRVAIGPRDLEQNQAEVARRDTQEKQSVSLDNIAEVIKNLLTEIQEHLFQKSLDFRNTHIQKVDSYEEFKSKLETQGGFFLAHWDGTVETEEKIQQETKATIRCIPFEFGKEEGKCMVTGKPSTQRVVFAKAY